MNHQPLTTNHQPLTRYAQRKPCFESGSDRTLVPDAAKIAFVIAGSMGGSDGSPRPVGGLFDFNQCASITGGDCAMRSRGTWWKLLWTTWPFFTVISCIKWLMPSITPPCTRFSACIGLMI